MEQPLIWLIALALFIIIEIVTLGLATIWFACGAAVAFIAALAGASVPVQFTLFVIVSLASLFAVRPYVAKKFTASRTKTNSESLIGLEGKVTEEIDNRSLKGTVYVNGLDWTARSQDDKTIIEKDALVEILEIQGVKLIVKKKKED